MAEVNVTGGQWDDQGAGPSGAGGESGWVPQEVVPYVPKTCKACVTEGEALVVATSFCKDCDADLCDPCWENLHRFGANRLHKKVIIEQPVILCEGVDTDSCIYDNSVQFYCLECDQTLCEPCWSSLHAKGTRKSHCALPATEADRLREQAKAPQGERKQAFDHFTCFDVSKEAAWVSRVGKLNQDAAGSRKGGLAAFGFGPVGGNKGGAAGAPSQRFAKVMAFWKSNLAGEVTLIVGSEGPTLREPEMSSLTWDVETIRSYATERHTIRQELSGYRRVVSSTPAGKNGTSQDKVDSLEEALKLAVKERQQVDYADHGRAIERLEVALEKDRELVAAFEVRREQKC